MLTIEAKDFVIVQEPQKRAALLQVTSVDTKTFSGILEQDRRKAYREIELSRKHVVVNLGPKPVPGNVYNIDVSNIYQKTISHEWWGSLHFYTRLEPAIMKTLRGSLDKTADRLTKLGFSAFADLFEVEIRAKKGKYAGMYQHRPGQSLLWFAPEWAQGSPAVMDEVLYHEFGHAVRFNGLSEATKIRQKWLRLYQQSIRPVTIPEKAFRSMLSHLKGQRDSDDEISFGEALKAFAAQSPKAEKTVDVLKTWLRQVPHLSTKELSLAWVAEDYDYLESVWPKASVDSSELSPVISEYATKNVEETFAECFAQYCLKKKLPEAYHSLMEKSLSIAKANKE